MTLLKPNAKLKITVVHDDPLCLYGLAVRHPGGTCHIVPASCEADFQGDRTRFAMGDIRLDGDVPEHGSSDDGPETVLADLLADACHGNDGHALLVDCEIHKCGVPVPNVPVANVLLFAPGEVILNCGAPAPTHPIEPRMTIDPLDREGVSYHLSEYIKKAIKVYLADGLARTWPLHEFIAEYAIQRGAWLDTNYDLTKAESHQAWIETDDGVPDLPDRNPDQAVRTWLERVT